MHLHASQCNSESVNTSQSSKSMLVHPNKRHSMEVSASNRDHGATLKLEGGGGTLVTRFGGRDRRHFFLLTLENFKNIGGGGGHVPPFGAPTPRSLSKSTLVIAN